MTITILEALEEALRSAASQPDRGAAPGAIHRTRSQQFVSTLGSTLRAAVQKHSNLRVFDKSHDGNRDEFGLNELLFDVLVCETENAVSPVTGRSLSFVTAARWVVESEFARNAREAFKDFNKLVLSHSANKLFVGPADSRGFLDALLPAAAAASRDGCALFCALIAHPDQWVGTVPSCSLFRFDGQRWQPDSGSQVVA